MIEPLKIYCVGGAVRDQLLGLAVQDRDWVVVGSTPEDMVARGFKPVGKDGQLPNRVVETANSKPAFEPNVLPGTVADYRFREGRGGHVFDDASGPFGMLELANLDWVVDEGRAHQNELVSVVVTKVLQTTAGRMIFAKLENNHR